MPISSVMVFAISSVRALRPSWIFFRYAARSAGGVALQASKARRAASTAMSASAALPCGTVASRAPSVGEKDFDAALTGRGDPLSVDVKLIALFHGVPCWFREMACAPFDKLRTNGKLDLRWSNCWQHDDLALDLAVGDLCDGILCRGERKVFADYGRMARRRTIRGADACWRGGRQGRASPSRPNTRRRSNAPEQREIEWNLRDLAGGEADHQQPSAPRQARIAGSV